MAHQKVALQLRIRLSNGKRAHVHPVFTANGRMKPLTGIVNGQPEHHPEGVYHLRYREERRLVYRAVGIDPADAQTKFLRGVRVLCHSFASLFASPCVLGFLPLF